MKIGSGFLISWLLCLSIPALGQQASRDPAVADKAKTDWLDIGLEHRTRYETLDNRFRLGEDGSDQQLPQRTRLRIGIDNIIAPFGFLMELEDARIHLNDSASTITNTMLNENDIQQFNVSVTLNGAANRHPSMLRFGRQTVDLGSRRLLARNRFRNTTNTFDGIRWTLSNAEGWHLNAFLLRPVRLRLRNPDVPHHGAYFWGAFLSGSLSARFQNEIYYLGIRESPTSPHSQKRRFSTIGTRLYRNPKAGTASYEIETVLQFGERGGSDHMAHFEHVSMDYTFDSIWQPKVTAMYDYASGDRDPTDNKDGTFDTLFGARRWEFGPTGIYGAWARANISSPGWALELNPSSKLALSTAMRWVWLASARGQWAGTRLQDISGRSGSYLGSQIELRAACDITKYFRSEVGYVRFFKGSYLDQVPGSPGSKDSNYLYVETSFIFDHLLKKIKQ